MTAIFFILIIITVIQIIMIMRKRSKYNYTENMDRVNELITYLENGYLKATDKYGRNILMIAVSSHFFKNKNQLSFVDVMKKAIEAGINVDEKCKPNGKTALFYAIDTEYNDECVEYLLQKGANPNLTDIKDNIPLFEAVKKGGKKYNLIVNKTKNIDHRNFENITPLMVAAKNMKINVIHDLLDRGADATLTNKANENTHEIAKKHASKYYTLIRDSHTDEGTHHDMSNNEEKAALKHNHEIDEVLRRLKCITTNKPYKYKKFKKHGIF